MIHWIIKPFRIKCFDSDLKTLLQGFFHKRCRFQMQFHLSWFFSCLGYADWSVLNLNPCYIWWHPRTLLFRSFHWSVNTPLLHTFIAILNRSSSIKFISFHTICIFTLSGHDCSSLVHSINEADVKYVTLLSLFKI